MRRRRPRGPRRGTRPPDGPGTEREARAEAGGGYGYGYGEEDAAAPVVPG